MPIVTLVWECDESLGRGGEWVLVLAYPEGDVEYLGASGWCEFPFRDPPRKKQTHTPFEHAVHCAVCELNDLSR